jgi:hypothetical protein
VKRSSGSSVRLPVRVTWLSLTFELLPSFFVGRSYALYRTYVRYVTFGAVPPSAAASPGENPRSKRGSSRVPGCLAGP